MQKQQIIMTASIVFGVFFGNVLMNFIIKRKRNKPYQLSWQAELLIILFILTAFVWIFIL